jgi:hypothetical protein
MSSTRWAFSVSRASPVYHRTLYINHVHLHGLCFHTLLGLRMKHRPLQKLAQKRIQFWRKQE